MMPPRVLENGGSCVTTDSSNGYLFPVGPATAGFTWTNNGHRHNSITLDFGVIAVIFHLYIVELTKMPYGRSHPCPLYLFVTVLILVIRGSNNLSSPEF